MECPSISPETKELIDMFLERKLFQTQNEVIAAAMELLIERQIEEESKTWNEKFDSIKKGIADSKAGRVKSLGSFSKYVETEDE